MRRSGGDLIAQAKELQRLALADCDGSRYDVARRRLQAALRKLDSAQLEKVKPADGQKSPADKAEAARVRIRTLVTLSFVEFESLGLDHGLDKLETAAALLVDLSSAELSFAINNARGLRALRAGRDAEALEYFASAEKDIHEALPQDACTLLLNRGNLYLEQLSLDQAQADLERCLELAQRASSDHELTSLAFMARHNHGYLQFLQGNLPAALVAMDQAARQAGDVSLAISYLDKARVLIEAGLADAADQALAEAAEEFRRGRMPQLLGETELARAECAVLADNLKAARVFAASARTRFKRRGNDRWRRVAELILVQADLAAGRPPTLLIGPAVRLAGEFADHGLLIQARTARLTACAAQLAAGQLVAAKQVLDQLDQPARTDPITLRLHQRAVDAALSIATQDTARARQEIRTGLAELSRHQAQFGSIDLQTASAVHGRRLVELDLQLALDSGRALSVFNAIERGRAVSTRLASVTAPTDESTDLLAELRHLTGILKIIGDDPGMAEQTLGIRKRISALHRQLSAISWRTVGDGDALKPAPMAEVFAAASSQGKIMIAFCESRGRFTALTMGATGTRLVPLPAGREILEWVRRSQADLNVLAYPRLPDQLRLAATASLRRTLSQLDHALLAPLALPDQPLVIVPTGELATLGWNCLPSLRGRAVEITPTATAWLRHDRTAETRLELPGVATFAGPGLQGADAEATSIAELWQGRCSVGKQATRARLATALASSSLVHVAAHGSHMHQNPLFSSLQLADGELFAYEISHDRLAPHVVLSACELGQNTLRTGDETLGLTSVLLQLGAQCVVAGVAHVADDRAAAVMQDYHRKLAGGADSATALADATAVEDGFVPFVCFGNSWHTGIETQPASKPTLR